MRRAQQGSRAGPVSCGQGLLQAHLTKESAMPGRVFGRCLSWALLLTLARPAAVAPRRALAAPGAATFVVNTTSDLPDATPGNGVCETADGNGFCTLRAAIQEANAWPGDDTITFSAAIPTPATFTLTRPGDDDSAFNGDLDITSNLTLTGRGAANTIINGNALVTNDRVMQIVSGNVTIAGVTLRGGNHNSGGGLRNSGGTLIVANSTISQSLAVDGGGLYNAATATLSNVVFIHNAGEHGGAIYNASGATLTLAQGSLLIDNEGYYEGGAIYNQGQLTVSDATISGNNHSYGCCGLAHLGGGVYNSAAGTVSLNNVILSDNDSRFGGGFYNAGTAGLNSVTAGDNTAYFGGALHNAALGQLSLTNSVVSDNLGGEGGALYNAGTLTVTNSALLDNNADARGGGVYNTGTLKLMLGTTLSGGSAYYDGGGLYNTGQATLTGVMVAGNFASTSSGYGGGIYNTAALTLTTPTLTGNQAAYGAGVYTAGPVVWTDGRLSQNKAANTGGGLYIHTTGRAALTGLRVNGNEASYGSGLYNGGTLTVTRLTLDNNTASYGGGIYNAGWWIGRNSTLANNQAGQAGGGVFNTGTVNLFNVTVAHNRAPLSDDEGGSTLGAGIYAQTGEFNFRNGLVAGNHVIGSTVLDDCSGAITTVGAFRISTTTGCTLTGPWALVTAASVGSLGHNGGPNPTVSLQLGSSAIDAGDPVSGCLDWDGAMATDQRGAPRVIGVRCDVGAYEYGAVLPLVWLPLVRK
jgi:CSLREA domain-containing protein